MSPRVAVVGAGGIGATHLAAYERIGADVAAIVDVNRETAEAAAERLGATAYADLDVLLREDRPDAVSICTPPVSHAALAIAALQAGVAVLCEKPMACSRTEGEEMIKAAEQSGALLTVGFCHRFEPEVEAMRSAIEAGRIGTPLTFRNRFSGPLADVENRWFSRPEVSGGGVLMDTCVHSVDLFRHLVGEVTAVRALTQTTATDRGPALDVEDTAVLSLRSASGVVGVIEASWRAAPGEAIITVTGSQGRLDVDYASSTLIHTAPDGTVTPIDTSGDDRFTSQARHFLNCVSGAGEPRVTMHDGLRAIGVLADAYADAASIPTTTQD